MNKLLIEKQLHKVLQVWTSCDENLLEKYYAKDFSANYYGTHIDYKILVERLHYMQKTQKNRQLDIIEIISNNNKAAVRFHYTAEDLTYGKVDLKIMASYHFNDELKINKAWAFANKPVNYDY